MIAGCSIEGHAIVSADGMIADADGGIPAGLSNDADWRLFQGALDRAALVVLGRKGHQRHPNPGRRRLVLTRSVTALEADPYDAMAHLWNPAGIPLDAVLTSLGIAGGTIAVAGAFDQFAVLFDSFALAEVHGLVLPGGTPCFSAGHPRTVLAAHGLVPKRTDAIDQEAGVTLAMWQRR